jgi:photosystem II stability/assembly factor-like uncharacterized protein
MTCDGRATWTQSTVPSSLGYVCGVSCPSSQHCVATGTDAIYAGGPGNPAAVYGSDGGQTWSPATASATSDGGLNQPDCVTRDYCVAVGHRGAETATSPGAYGTVMYSSDGGKSWH